MNTDMLKGEWAELKGAIKQRWGKLTDDDLTRIEGSREKLAGRIQKTYGVARDEAEAQLREWESEHNKFNA